MDTCNPVATQYVKPAGSSNRSAENDEPKAISQADATQYRRAAARINYVALDRPDLSFACRVASSHMSNPKEGDEHVVKRIIRYLRGKPGVAIRYEFQKDPPPPQYFDSVH